MVRFSRLYFAYQLELLPYLHGSRSGLAAGTAGAFSALSEVQDISSNAQALIDTADGKLGPVQWVFWGLF